MYPTIFSIGNFHLKTVSILMVLAFLSIGFILWRRGKEEHYSEIEIFDAFLLSFLTHVIVSRLAFIVLHFQDFQFAIFKWLDVINHPGSIFSIGLIAAGFKMYCFAYKKKWDAFEIMDFSSQALSIGLLIVNLGYFFEGSSLGKTTSMPWGLQLAQDFEKKHPVSLYFALFYLLLFCLLSWFEYHYRTFEWYRQGKKSAQSGFLFSSFLIFTSIFSSVMLLFRLPIIVIQKVSLDFYINILGLTLGLLILYIRSGRSPLAIKDNKLWIKRS